MTQYIVNVFNKNFADIIEKKKIVYSAKQFIENTRLVQEIINTKCIAL